MKKDYSKYSLDELLEVKEKITQENSPAEYDNFINEFNSRKGEFEALYEAQKTRSKKRLIAVAWFQIVCGALFFLSLIIIAIVQGLNLKGLLPLFISFVLAIFSCFCGCKLLSDIEKGIRYSYINQLMQVISFSFGFVSYNYNTLAGFYVYANTGFQLGLWWEFSPGFLLSWGDVEPGFFAIDLISLTVLFLIHSYTTHHRQQH